MGLSDSADAKAGQLIADLPGITWHIIQPLEKAGITLVSQLQAMKLDEIEAIISGPKILRRLMELIGRADEYERAQGKFDVTVTDPDGTFVGSVPMGVLRQICTLTGTARYFNFAGPEELKQALRDGQRLDPVTGEITPFAWEDLARYKLHVEKHKAEEAKAKVERSLVESGMVDPSAFADLDRRIQERMDEYARDYDTTEWMTTDLNQLRTLAYMEQRLEALLKQQAGMRPTTDNMGLSKMMTEEAIRLTESVQRMRNELQVSLKSRLASKTQAAADEVVTDLIARGKRLWAERGSFFQHCGILQAVFLPNFPDMLVRQNLKIRCVKCGKVQDWTLVTPEMLERYTSAGSFIPDDAPAGIFDRK